MMRLGRVKHEKRGRVLKMAASVVVVSLWQGCAEHISVALHRMVSCTCFRTVLRRGQCLWLLMVKMGWVK